ncbi:MAG: enoyl-CoA hydratase, partial [Bacteroidota bacterium]
QIEEVIRDIVEELKQNSPKAMQLGLEAFDHIQASEAQHQYLMGMLLKAIGSKDGQEGLKAFKEKRKPIWTGA